MLHQQLHFCTRNTTKQDKRLVESSALSASFLKRQMDLSRSRQIIVILDCCYSGAIGDLLKKGEEEIDYGELQAAGRVILASSSAAKVSLQLKDGLSLYTRYLIQGMKGDAYPGQGAWITARSLHEYADRHFEIENKGYPPKIISDETGFNMPIVRAPKADPKLEYRKVVDRIFQELDEELDLEFSGTIEDELDRGSLDTSRDNLGIDPEQAKTIEEQVQQPYLIRAEKRREYANYFKTAIQNNCLPTGRNRRRLDEICENLLLGKAQADRIEQKLTQELNLNPVLPLTKGESEGGETSAEEHQDIQQELNQLRQKAEEVTWQLQALRQQQEAEREQWQAETVKQVQRVQDSAQTKINELTATLETLQTQLAEKEKRKQQVIADQTQQAEQIEQLNQKIEALEKQLKQASQTLPQPKAPSDEVMLESEKNVNYTELQDLLKAQDWKAADRVTYRLMATIMGRKEGDYFRKEELLNFPCKDLKTIDRLWGQASQGRYGFSVQKEIYIRCGGILDSQYPGDEIWEKFGREVGWYINNAWQTYDDLSWGVANIKGHLPHHLLITHRVAPPRGSQGSGLFSLVFRLEQCECNL
jgi:hypothetical protein